MIKRPVRIYTVSEITQDIKLILENTFTQIWVEGEVSGLSRIPTGTVFFNLKDGSSLLKCVIFFSAAANIKFELKDGMKLVCCGGISVYEKDGRYQLYVQSAEPKGIGSLQLALEQLKQKLEKEGLFRPQRKRPIPYLPSRIGVVTSLSGAAIRDILKVLDRRFKDTQIVISPVKVQGEGAKEEIAQAIKDFNVFNSEIDPDERIEVMIVGRGGGSIEDLWAFNEETVARAIYNSRIPVISAVGHERDVTIADLVADMRAATPSVAAELVIPRKEDLRSRLIELTQDLRRTFSELALHLREDIDELLHRLLLGTTHVMELDAGRLNLLVKKLTLLNPKLMIARYQEKITDLAGQIHVRLGHFIKLRQAEFAKAAEKLSGLSPLNILGRGYSITFKMPQDAIIKNASGVKAGEIIKTKLHAGEILSRVVAATDNEQLFNDAREK
ncbi:MAG: exodeoxyribonuclease VII large subunit [Candidatus Omnitrophica bacterium]|nr:exodeoxyribonuclease VII large subunit [Candidatus Omnitrophota bacterium]